MYVRFATFARNSVRLNVYPVMSRKTVPTA
jgi:hypothetical protein